MRSALLLSVTALTATVLLASGCQNSVEYRVVRELPRPVFGDEQVVVVPRPAPQIPAQPQVSPPAPQTGAARLAPVPDWENHSKPNGWRYIVIHHSATASGSAGSFDRTHRHVNKWEHGLGYHFVIGNGNGTRDGQVEVGHRWRSQMQGAHCKTNDNRYNNNGIGICLVGNFEQARPTAAQLASLQTLVVYLSERYDIPVNRIYGHGEAVAVMNEGRGTKCPGKYFDMDVFRQAIRSSRLALARN